MATWGIAVSRSVLDGVRGLVATALAAVPSFAQCGVQWDAGLGVPGVTGRVFAAQAWDRDGVGPIPPLLVLGGEFREAGPLRTDNLVAYDPASGVWTPFGGVNGAVSALAVAANGDLIVGGPFTNVAGLAVNGVARWNGSSWSPLGSGAGPGGVFALAVLQNGDLVAGGDFPFGGIARWNGVSWVAMGSGVGGASTIVRSLAVLPNGDLVAGGVFATAGGLASPCVARWSGSAWSSMCSTITNVNTPVVSATLALPNGDLVIAGAFTSIDGVAANNLARWSNGSWTPFGMGSAGGIQSLARLPNGDLVAGGYFLLGGAETMARWDGIAWSPFVDSPNFTVHGLTVMPNGDLVAGGDFTAIGTAPALGVARWDGTNWSQLSSGAGALGGGDQDVLAAVSMQNGDLVVGGSFTTIGGILAQRVARWNGSTWSAIGPGLPGTVQGLGVLPNGDLVAGGSGGVFRWDGSNWGTLLTMGTVNRLAVLANGNLLVAGGALGSPLYWWNGTTWSTIPFSGFFVNAVTQLPNGDVVLGGWFNSVGGVPVNNIARWDGTTWSALGGGMNGAVSSLAVTPDGSLVAGGSFTFAGGIAVNRTARWNGATWSPLGVAPFGIGQLLPLPNGDLLASSSTTFGGVTQFDRWDGSAWSSLGPGCDHRVYGMLARANGEVVVHGSFLSAGGTASARLARFASTCPASAVSSGAGCTGSAGPNVLTAASLPWLGSTFKTVGTGLPATANVYAVVGLSPAASGIDLSQVFPEALAGCVLHVNPDAIVGLGAAAGSVEIGMPLPNTPSLAGAAFQQQLVVAETGGGGAITAITVTNALDLVAGFL